MYMKDWARELGRFIVFRERLVLTRAGSITREEADEIALEQYKIYKTKTRLELTQVEQDFIDAVNICTIRG